MTLTAGVLLAVLALGCWAHDLKELRSKARSVFYHGYNGYLDYAFPLDELRPLSCTGLGRDWDDPGNIGINDVLGDYSLTLVDSMDALLVFGDEDRFQEAVMMVEEYVDFNISSKVQVFEVTIRMLGGLLAAHQQALAFNWYKGTLLPLAYDLGQRLLPAFNTPTGIPLARINLATGLVPHETTETNAAASGSLNLEFALLSHLTGDGRFERVAKKAFFAIWNRRSAIDLIGNTIDASSGLWTSASTGICAGVDSYFEYAFKSYILFGDVEYLRVWEQALVALKKHVIHTDEGKNVIVHLVNGIELTPWSDALAAYFSGLASLAGEADLARKMHAFYHAIYCHHGFVPERFNHQIRQVELGWHPLRPEFIESTLMMWLSTRDPYYLQLGVDMLESFERLKTNCGYANINDVRTLQLEDRMESFFLGESMKYLYLMFSPNHQQNRRDSNAVFSTEAHLLQYDKPVSRPMKHRQCIRPGESLFYSYTLNQPDFFWSFASANSTLPSHYSYMMDPRATSAPMPKETYLELTIPGKESQPERDADGNIKMKDFRGQKVVFLNGDDDQVRVVRVGRFQIGKYENLVLQDATGLDQFSSVLVDNHHRFIGPSTGKKEGRFPLSYDEEGLTKSRGCVFERGKWSSSLNLRKCDGFNIVVDRNAAEGEYKPLTDKRASTVLLFGERAWEVLKNGVVAEFKRLWTVRGKVIVNVYVEELL